MSSKKSQNFPVAALEEAAAAYQAAHIVTHCGVCVTPCCRLETQVLELEWRQVKVFWKVEESRPAFDRRLAAGQGPQEIRAGDDGLYYAHKKTCPAYDEAGRSCRVYGQALKPAGCTDYPVYVDGDCVVADLRCEAVDIAVLQDWIARALGPDFRVVRFADRDFPFLITLEVRRAGNPAKKARR